MISKITKYSITALLLSLLITTTAHAYAPIAGAVGRGLAGMLARNPKTASAVVTVVGGTVAELVLGGDNSPDDIVLDPPTTTPPPVPTGGGVWVTNDVLTTISSSPYGSCMLARKEYGSHTTPKLKWTGSGWLCQMDWGVTHNPQFPVTRSNSSLSQNPHYQSIVNDLINKASQGNAEAQDIVRQAMRVDNPSLTDTQLDDIIKDLQKGAGAGTGTQTDTGTGTGTQTNTQTDSQAHTNAKLDEIATSANATAQSQAQTNQKLDETNAKLDEIATSANATAQAQNQTNSKLDSIIKAIRDYFVWARTEPTLPPTEQAPVKELELNTPQSFDKNYLQANSQCPADVVKTFNTGFAQNEIRFEFAPICDFAKDFMRPVIIFMAYISAIFIISSGFKIG